MQAKLSLAPKITVHYLEYDNMKYFRENALSVETGSYGNKIDPFGPRAYLDPHAKIKADNLAGKVDFVTAGGFDWQQTSSADIGLNGSLPVFGMNGSAAVNFSYEKAKNEKVTVAYFQISEAKLLAMLNKDADGARKYLAGEGDDGRVCSGVWLWTEAELAETFQTSVSVTASVASGSSGLSITAKGGKNGVQTITVLPGSTCAYMLYKVKKWKDKDKTQVEEIESDFKGNG